MTMTDRIESLLQPDSTRECLSCESKNQKHGLDWECLTGCSEEMRVIADLLKERDEMRLRLQYAECVFCGLYVQGCSCSDWARVLRSCPTCHGNHTPDQLCGHGGSD
jgi:hypothetical protein